MGIFNAINSFVTFNNNTVSKTAEYDFTAKGYYSSFNFPWVEKSYILQTAASGYYQAAPLSGNADYAIRDLLSPVEFVHDGIWLRYFRKYRVTINDLNDPVNNFSIYHMVDANGNPLSIGSACEVYRVSGGVVSYPCTQQR